MKSKRIFGRKENEIFRIMSHTRVNEKEIIDWELDSLEIIKKARNNESLYKFNESVDFCCNKTLLDGNPAIVFVFIIKLLGTSTNSAKSSKSILEIIRFLESILTPIDKYDLKREIIKSKEHNIALLKVVKKDSDDIL